MSDLMNICLASDENYACYMGLTMMSILENSQKEDEFVFYILDNQISESSKRLIEQLKTIKFFEIHWIPISNETLAGCKVVSETLTITTFARLLIPNLIPEDKILYLDCDIFVRTSLYPLFHTDINDFFGAGVTDFYVNHTFVSNEVSPEIKPDFYFNAGVLLINSKKWRENNTVNQLLDYAAKNSHKFLLADQECLNFVLRSKIKILDPAWNVLDQSYDPVIILKHKDKDKIIRAAKKPYIRHFKPWKKNNRWEFREEYIEMMKRSAWAHLVPADDFHLWGWLGLFFIHWKKYPFFFASPRFYLRMRHRGFRRTLTRKIS